MREFTTTAIFKEYFKHFNINPKAVSLYGVKVEDIVNVKVTMHEDQSIPAFEEQKNNPNADYWAFVKSDDKGYNLIFHKRFILNVCFPYGIESSENAGHGKAYRVKVEQID